MINTAGFSTPLGISDAPDAAGAGVSAIAPPDSNWAGKGTREISECLEKDSKVDLGEQVTGKEEVAYVLWSE